jgi:ribosome recycling factor
MSLIDETRKEMQSAIEHLKNELKNIRTGRANPGMVEGVQVEVYGTNMRLSDLASITSPEAQQLLITPFDANNAATIGKSLEKANLGVQVIAEGNIVRVIQPAMDESVRKEMVKQVKKRCEEAKVSIRNTRRKFNEQSREMKASGDLAEDQMHRNEKEIQKLTDDFCTQSDQIGAAKEKEVTTI